jgi:hypothetical protein
MKFPEVYDSHIHSEGRGQKELSEMAESGIRYANSCAYYPVKPLYPETLIDLFRKLESFETERGRRVGMKIIPAFGIHPRCIPNNWRKVTDFLAENAPRILGEIGLEGGSSLETEVFREQLRIAKSMDIPCIIHTPRKKKTELTEKILRILDEISFPEDLAVVDHISLETFPDVIGRGYHAGLTVESGKLSEVDVLEILEKFGPDRIMINSDSGFTSLDYLSTSRTIGFLIKEGFAGKDLKMVAVENAKAFFKL